MERVSEQYSAGAVNQLNSLFYSSFAGDYYETDLANLYTSSSAVFAAMGDLLKKESCDGKLRIKQLSSGSAAINMWKSISKSLGGEKYEVLLTDFVEPEIYEECEGVKIKTGECNLLRDFECLREEERFDVMLATYGFDSVWFQEDGFYEKVEGKWYVVKYRLVVDGERYLVNDLRRGFSEKGLSVEEFQQIGIEEERERINIELVHGGRLIKEYFRDCRNVRTSFPGGMIEKVKQAFDRQLKEDGTFVLGEVVVPDKEGARAFDRASVSRSGAVARYKVEDYGLAKWILEREGFEVEMIPVVEFVKNYRELDPTIDVKIGERGKDTNYVVMVSRK